MTAETWLWLSTNAAAKALGVHRRTLQRRARNGDLQTRERPDGAVEYRIRVDGTGTGTGTATPVQTAPAARTADPIDYRPILTRIAEALEGIELALDIGIGVARPTSKGGKSDDDGAEDRAHAVGVRAFVPF